MKRERAFVESRRNRIVEIMEEKPEVRVDELSQLLGVSLITIRSSIPRSLLRGSSLNETNINT